MALRKWTWNNCSITRKIPKIRFYRHRPFLDGLRNNLADETRKLDAKKNEHDLLKSMIDSMEGYPDSV
ncbi:MAG: hypothetical protein V9F01_13235 [Chitinophagaceae bacterium]